MTRVVVMMAMVACGGSKPAPVEGPEPIVLSGQTYEMEQVAQASARLLAALDRCESQILTPFPSQKAGQGPPPYTAEAVAEACGQFPELYQKDRDLWWSTMAGTSRLSGAVARMSDDLFALHWTLQRPDAAMHLASAISHGEDAAAALRALAESPEMDDWTVEEPFTSDEAAIEAWSRWKRSDRSNIQNLSDKYQRFGAGRQGQGDLIRELMLNHLGQQMALLVAARQDRLSRSSALSDDLREQISAYLTSMDAAVTAYRQGVYELSGTMSASWPSRAKQASPEVAARTSAVLEERLAQWGASLNP